MPTKPSISKPPKVERARQRLDAAVRRLERVIAERLTEDDSDDAAGAAQERLAAELEALRDENTRLRTLNRTVSERLDSAIGRIRSAIAE